MSCGTRRTPCSRLSLSRRTFAPTSSATVPRAMTRRYTHLTVQQMRDGFQKLDAASPINVAPGVPVASAARGEVMVRALPDPSGQDAAMQADAAACSGANDSGLTTFRGQTESPGPRRKVD